MAEAFIGEIRLFTYTSYTPKGWLSCDGQNLPVQQYQALYAVIGNTFGGKAGVNFNLPKLSGQTVAGVGTGPGLTNRTLGTSWGESSAVAPALPAHAHTLVGNDPSSTNDLTGSPTSGQSYVSRSIGQRDYAPFDGTQQVTMASQAIGVTGTASPAAHNNMQPYLVLNYAICFDGLFPVSG